MAEKILVVGATGKVGRPLVRELTGRGLAVRAATRDPEAAAKQLSADHLRFERFDYDQPDTWDASLSGIERVFLQATSGDAHPEEKLIPFVDRFQTHGVTRVVFMTAMGVEHNEDLGLRKVERHIERSGLAYTFLRPNWFMQNFVPGFIYDSIQNAGGIYLPAADAKVSFIDARDIAAVAAVALTEDGHAGKAYALTGAQAIDHHQAAQILTDAAGCKQIPYVPVSDEDARKGLLAAGWETEQAEFMLGLFAAIRQGHAARVDGAVRQVLGREPIPFESFAEENAPAFC